MDYNEQLRNSCFQDFEDARTYANAGHYELAMCAVLDCFRKICEAYAFTVSEAKIAEETKDRLEDKH